MEITAEAVRRSLIYDPYTGEFRWLNPGKCANARYRKGASAGSVNRIGRLMINVCGKPRQASRLAWLYHYGEQPPEFIDHIDGDPLNNAIGNLRACTRSQNAANSRRPERNISGFKGVGYHPSTGKWRARIRVHRKLISLGLYDTGQLAHEAYLAAAQRHFGEFARAA